MGLFDTIKTYFLPGFVPERKGLYELHPELRDRQHLGSFSANATATAPTQYTYLSAISDYKSYPWVYKAISAIANNIAQLPLVVKRGDDVIEAHPFAQLFQAVNDAMSSADLWHWWTVDMMLAGESAFEFVKARSGSYVEVWPRQPNTVNVRVSEQGKRYMKIDGYTVDDGQGNPYQLPPDEMLLFKLYNPSQPFRGLAPISAARTSVDIDKATLKWNKDFYERGARPDYQVLTPQGTARSEREQLERELEAKYTGRSSKPFIGEQGVVEIVPLGWPPRDMAWLDQRQLSREEVGAIFGVPDEIMGWGRDTYENFETARRVFWSLTLKPLIAQRDTALNEWGRRNGALRSDEEIMTDLSTVEELREALTLKLDNAQKLAALNVPFNRIDEMLDLGVGAIPNGEIGNLDRQAAMSAFALVPAGELPAPEDDAPQDEPAQLAAPVQIAKAEAVEAEVKMIVPKGVAVEFGGELHRALYGEFIKRTTPAEARLGKVVAQAMRDLEAEVLRRLRSGTKSISDVDEEPFDREEWQREFAKRIRPEHRRIVREAGARALRDVGVGVAFDLRNPRVTAFLRERAQRFAQAVAETTWNKLQATITAGLEAGETIDEIADRIEATMELRVNQSSTTIARTEVIGATNGGAVEGYRQSGVVSEKQWIATLDDRVRDTHAEANGQTVPLDEDFEVGDGSGPAPGQIGIAAEDINCRCAVAAVVEP